MNFDEKIQATNEEISNDSDELEYLKGFEIILEAFVIKMADLFGKNALLSMGYQIGVSPGAAITKRLLRLRKGVLFDDPFEAFAEIMKQNKAYYVTKILSAKIEPYNSKNDKLLIEFTNKCFYRKLINDRPGLRIGGPTCRINKGYFETAMKGLCGLNCDFGFIRNDAHNQVCHELLTIYVPKGKYGIASPLPETEIDKIENVANSEPELEPLPPPPPRKF